MTVPCARPHKNNQHHHHEQQQQQQQQHPHPLDHQQDAKKLKDAVTTLCARHGAGAGHEEQQEVDTEKSEVEKHFTFVFCILYFVNTD